ncbi:MAG: O-antigen ligase family protein [Panacagrimonas sp.]
MTTFRGDRIAVSKPPEWAADRGWTWLAVAFMVVPFCLCSINLDPGSERTVSLRQTEPSSIFRNGWLLFIALSGMVAILRFSLATRLLRHVNPWMLALLGWCFASALWAPDANFTLRRVVLLSGATLVAIGFVLMSWHPRRFENILLPLCIALLSASVVAALLVPGYGIHSPSGEIKELIGAWRGVTGHKNGLGAISLLTLLLLSHAWASRRISTLRALAGAALAAFLLVMASSSTAMLLSVLVCSVTIATLRPPPVRVGRGQVAVTLAAAVLVVPLVAFVAIRYGVEILGLISGWFGKDITFSGRTDIWIELVREISSHPWFGVGYSGFWNGLGSLSDQVVRKIGYIVPNGHNGYLDIANELGVVGLLLLLGFLVRHARDVARVGRLDRQQLALHGALFVYFLVANLTESLWFLATSPIHLLMMFSSLTLSRHMLQHELLSQRRTRTNPERERPGVSDGFAIGQGDGQGREPAPGPAQPG